MNLNFYKSESTVCPDEVDTTSSPTTVYIRKNIRQETFIDADGRELTAWRYDEAKISKAEYNQHMQDKAQADISYLYMIGGLDYNE